jgi:hypothetical protein
LPKDIANEVSKFIKEDSIVPIRKVIAPIEDAIHDLSVELLSGLESAYILDNKKEVERLRKEVEAAIANIKQYAGEGSDKAHEMLYRQLLKLNTMTRLILQLKDLYFSTMVTFTSLQETLLRSTSSLGCLDMVEAPCRLLESPGRANLMSKPGWSPHGS